jgi:hypothetical protein
MRSTSMHGIATISIRFFFQMFCFFICCSKIFAETNFSIGNNFSDTAEKKVDYLERIYFSGENKAGLNSLILVAMQEMQSKDVTPSLLKQATFLSEIRDDAEKADDACDVLDILAVGIYEIDAAEARSQGIEMPSDKVRKKTGNALASIGQLGNATTNLGGNAQTLGWSAYYSKNPKLSSGAFKTANKLNTASQTLGAVGQGAKTINDTKNVIGSLFNKEPKDKPCKKVKPKEIIVSDRKAAANEPTATSAAAGNSVTVIIKNITYSQLSSLAGSMEKITDITNVNSDNFSSNTATIVVTTTLKIKEVVDKILQANEALGLNVDSFTSNTATLFIK